MVTYGGQHRLNWYLEESRGHCDYIEFISNAIDAPSRQHRPDGSNASEKKAMKSYLEARQRADLGRDIATCLLPIEGPFAAGDRVY